MSKYSFCGIIVLFLAVSLMYAQDTKKILFTGNGKSSIDTKLEKGMHFKGVQCKINITDSDCILVFENVKGTNKAKGKFGNIPLVIAELKLPIASLHDFKMSGGGNILEFKKHTDGSEWDVKIDSKDASKIMELLQQVKNTAK